jgi:hypothetical protein
MIYILYRHTGNISGRGKNRPEWFSYEKSLNNILSTIEGLDFVQFHLLYDGEYRGSDPRIHHVENFQGGSDAMSYVFAWNYAKSLNLNDNDLVYFAENDYAFIPGWPQKIQELVATYENLDYITLYDHVDKYNYQMYPNLSTYLFITKTHHWRLVPSTTGNVIVTKKVLHEDFDVHTANPGSDKYRFEYLGENKKRTILSPIPSLATHCEVEWLAPAIDWSKI